MEYLNSYSDLEHLQLVAGRIAESGIDITSDYKDWLEVTFACASLGEAAREPYHTICSQYPNYTRHECDAKFDNCLLTGRGNITIATLMLKAKENGIDVSLPRGRRPLSEEKRKEEHASVMNEVKDYLRNNRKWRHNTLTGKVEYNENGGCWKEVDDRFIDTLLTRLREKGLPVRDNVLRSLVNSIDFAPDYAPHLEWLKSLPAWNPETDPDYIRDFFFEHMEFGPMADLELYNLVFHRWLVAVVALWRGEIDANPIMPTFCGLQQIGKSFLASHLLPPCLQAYQTAISPNDPINKDTMLTLSEVLLVIFDEISINSDSKSNTMKFLLTSGQINLRDAYGHYRKARQRMASVIATTNYYQFIRETEGNRRYIGIDLVGTKNIYEHPLNYEGAYSQAIYLLEHGYEPKPTYDESLLISAYNRRFLTPNDCEEALLTFVRKPRVNEKAEAFTAGDLLRELNSRGFQGRGFSTVTIGKAMKSLGFEPHRVNGYNKYDLVLADFDRQKREREGEAIHEPVPF